jgi:hypothetical protein
MRVLQVAPQGASLFVIAATKAASSPYYSLKQAAYTVVELH